MPRATPTPSTPKVEKKPYDRSSPSPTFNSPEGSKRGQGRPWTGEEKVVIFDLAMKYGATQKVFEGCLEGRTAKQCYLTWMWVPVCRVVQVWYWVGLNTMRPALRKHVLETKKR